MMDIAVIGFYGFYGSICEWVANALEPEHKVTRYDRKLLPNIGMNHQLYIYVDCSEDYSSILPYTNAPSIFWSMDSGMPGGLERSTNIGRKCDLVFSSNKEVGVDLLRKFGVDSYLLPVTYSEKLLKDAYKHPKDISIAMIGNPNSPQRQQLWNEIKMKYKDSVVGRLEHEKDYVNAMNRAKIVINQPTEPYDNILNNRMFEGMASGALVLQKKLKTTLIEDLGFTNGEDFVYWENFDDLFNLIGRFLKDYKTRGMIVENAFNKVTSMSMENQCRKMIDIALKDLPIK